MKKVIGLAAAIPMLIGVAFAQDPNQSQTPTSPAQTTDTRKQTTTTTTTTTGTYQTGNTEMREMKTQTYKGTLVDAACAMPGSMSTASTTTTATVPSTGAASSMETNPNTTTAQPAGSGSTSAGTAASTGMPETTTATTQTNRQMTTSESTATTTEYGKPKEHRNEANRSDSADQAACPVSASTTRFAMKLDDGRTVLFDSVGNERAQEAIKTKKKWNDAISSGKPIHAKVSAVMTGDRLTVVTIN